jgi:hypothetical protein
LYPSIFHLSTSNLYAFIRLFAKNKISF